LLFVSLAEPGSAKGGVVDHGEREEQAYNGGWTPILGEN